MRNWITVLGWLLVALLVVQNIRSCNGENAAIKSEQAALDAHKKTTDSIKGESDSLKGANETLIIVNHNDSLSYSRKIDSFKVIVSILKGRFLTTKDSINLLYSQLKVFYEAGDSNALKTAYLSLRQQLDEAGQQLFAIQIARDSSDYAKDNEIERLNGVVKTLQAQLDRCFLEFSKEVDVAISEGKIAQTLLNKQKKGKFMEWLRLLGVAIAGLLVGSKL